MTDVKETRAHDNNIRGTGERILVADDDPSIREWLETFLTMYGYTVVCASDAANALEVFGKEQGDFDLLFTVVTLPKTSGVELAVKISSLRPKMPVLLGSGYMTERVLSLVTDSKRYPFLSKPYMTDELLKTIKQLIRT